MAPNRKAFDHGDPWLFDAGAMDIVRKRIGARNAAHEFMHETELTLDEPEEGDLSPIKMREIDPAAEYPASAVFDVLDLPAPEHGDIAPGVERRQIDADFGRIDRGLVLRIQIARILQGDVDRISATLDRHCAKVHKTIGDELFEIWRRIGSRQQHRVTKMRTRAHLAQHVRQKYSLVNFHAFLVALQPACIF